MSTISIDRKTRERLRSIGHKQQTYDEIINELLEESKKCSVNSGKLTDSEVS